jgi:hypothetical protein
MVAEDVECSQCGRDVVSWEADIIGDPTMLYQNPVLVYMFDCRHCGQREQSAFRDGLW